MSKIIVDTREQKPYSFYGHEVINKKLDTGDYSIEGFEDVFAVERKSLNDYLSSITHNRKRFEREVDRGSEMQEFVVVIESSEERVRDGRYRSEVAPLAAINTAKAWSKPERYGVPFVWSGGRPQAKALTLDYLRDWENIYSTSP